MNVDQVRAHAAEVHRLQETQRLDKQHADRVQDAAKIKQRHEIDEAARVEINRRMNRPGQNVDRMA
jgi:hypothetical protein